MAHNTENVPFSSPPETSPNHEPPSNRDIASTAPTTSHQTLRASNVPAPGHFARACAEFKIRLAFGIFRTDIMPLPLTKIADNAGREAQQEALFDPDAPLRLSVAAKIAFPDGSMKAAGLRREHARGRLKIERIAGRDYTTRRAIEEMRQLCLVQPRAPASTAEGAAAEKSSGSFETANTKRAQVALKRTLKELKQLSKSTSPKSEKAEALSQVVPLRS